MDSTSSTTTAQSVATEASRVDQLSALNVVERMYQIACNGQPKGLSMTRYLTYNVPVEIFKRVGVRLLVMSASAAIGTLVKPGVGTTMVVLVVDFALMPPIYNSINRAAGIM